ncbi:TPM domain-containing protein [Patescibacteria group bacterium]|nr:TPM domain-containing protein [Patescibacteria group bacterium]
MRKTLIYTVVLGLCILFGGHAIAAEPLYPERPTGFVNDQAGMLGDSDDLEQMLSDFEAETSNELAVITINSLEGVSIEEYSEQLFQKWGIGKAEKDNGALLVVVKDDREMRIETGYGLEGALPDALADQIIRKEITPEFKEGRYHNGVKMGLQAIMAATKGEYNPIDTDPESESTIAGIVGFGIFLLVVVIIVVSSIFAARATRKGGRRGGGSSSDDSSSGSSWTSSDSGSSWGSGSSSSFGGFSGGSSGGGGASGRW